ANDNNGDVAIKTGDVAVDTSVSNQANTSTVATGACCTNSQGTVVVSGNGADSSNTVSVTNSTTIATTTNQTATITNTVKGTATTGNNTANDNQGSVTIITGNISHMESILTGPINTASVIVGLPDPSYTVKIKGNGAGSVNSANVATSLGVTHTLYNTTNIFNDSFWELLTGGNITNRNNGDVYIKTGDIESKIVIENTANKSYIKDDCCQKNEPPTPTPPTPTPTNKPGDGGGNGGGGGSSSGSSTAANGNILPATGGSWMLFVLIGNIIMLFFGVFLRLRSGRSPGFTYHFV
ncbi:MAG: hypothetical protein Q8Q49_05275, partial [bacterium]|nr:hypothetical protein [bacterium]